MAGEVGASTAARGPRTGDGIVLRLCPASAATRPRAARGWPQDDGAPRTPSPWRIPGAAGSCPRSLAGSPPAVTPGRAQGPSRGRGGPRVRGRRPVGRDGPQEQVKGTGGGLPCLLTRRERGTGNDSGEDHQEHEDARRYDQQRRPPSGQRNKDAHPGGSRPPAHGRQPTLLLSARALHLQQFPPYSPAPSGGDRIMRPSNAGQRFTQAEHFAGF
jgi:hypothetical protein